MVDLSIARKNKITLSDYDYQKDIENRLLLASFSSLDLSILEEILYSSVTIPLGKLLKNLDIEEEEILPILQKLSHTGLFKIQGDIIHVDKEMRKYFETEVMKFEEDFVPGMEFLQGLLHKVPIHALPAWYAIPRTSNNIFDSLVEKYLLTPQFFQRYLVEVNFMDPALTAVIDDVYQAPDFEVPASVLMEKYGLTHYQFEELLLQLEFNFVCCLRYKRQKDHWIETVTPFHEWREYLRFLRDTEPLPLSATSTIKLNRAQDFAFIQDMSAIVALAKKEPITLSVNKEGQISFSKAVFSAIAAKCQGLEEGDPQAHKYLRQVIAKLRLLKLADLISDRLYALEGANDWLDMRLENRALYVYRHPLNRILSVALPSHLCTEKSMREAEKSLARVLQTGWVDFNAFLEGVTVPLGDHSMVTLKKMGKTWKYCLPSYTEEEKSLLRALIFEWLFEVGVVATGTYQGKDCFSVTPFGQSLFAR